MAVLNKSGLFPQQLETEVFSKVKGHSSLAKMSGQEALPFVGKDIFTFNYSNDISVLGEGVTKPAGDGVVTPISVQPIKVVYQMRVSNEFLYANEEYQTNVLSAFTDGFAAKLGAGLDKMAMHGINPATGEASSTIGDNNFDSKVTNSITQGDAAADAAIEDAIGQVESAEYVANGIIISSKMRSEIAKLESTDKVKKYPEFAFGATPGTLGSMQLDTNATVESDKALIGDFSAFKWGIAKEIPLETIEYGDPDGQGDLKALNQVVLRSEAFIGWGILDPAAFAIVK